MKMGDDNVDWHLKKEVSYGHIISTIVLILMMAGGWIDIQSRLTLLEEHPKAPAHGDVDKRLDRLEAELMGVHAVDAAMAIRLEDLHQEILRMLNRQNVKLDRIEDRLNDHDSRKPGG